MTCYHVRITKKSDRSWDVVWLDLNWEELEDRIIAPYRTGQPITINGQSIAIDDIEQIRINETETSSSSLRLEVEQERRSSNVFTDIPIDWYIANKGREVTNILITTPPGIESMSVVHAQEPRPSADARAVFVSHGRNDDARDAVFEFLQSIDLHPIEWSEAVKATGKPAPYIGEILNAAFSQAHAVVVLLTPDDEARLIEQFRKPDDASFESVLTGQARQNVLFEAGAAMASHPNRTVIVQLGNLRPFSNISGIHTIRLGSSPEQRQDFAQRLESAGCPVRRSGNRWYRAGNFDAVIAALSTESSRPDATSERQQDFSDDCKLLLIEAVKDPNGNIHKVRVFGGLILETNRKQFPEMGNTRSEAQWEQALQNLVTLGFIQDISGKGEVFRVTHSGFQATDALSDSE